MRPAPQLPSDGVAVGLPLFKLEDGFVSDLCFGMNSATTVEFFVAALDDGREVVEQRVRAAVDSSSAMADFAETLDFGFEDGYLVVGMPGELAAIEFGVGASSSMPVIRTAVQSAVPAIEAAIEKALGER